MITEATVERLCWHAGLQKGLGENVPSIAWSTWPRGRAAKDLEEAVADCLNALATLNRELNGEPASPAAVHGAGDVPRKLAYAMIEIVRVIRDSQGQAQDQESRRALARAAWRIETAWSAVLAGDINDLLKHVEQEEAAQSEQVF